MISQEEIEKKWAGFQEEMRKVFHKTVDDAIADLIQRMQAPTPQVVIAPVSPPAAPTQQLGRSRTLTMPQNAVVPHDALKAHDGVGGEARSEPFVSDEDEPSISMNEVHV